MKLLNKIQDCISKDEIFYSFEFFPPKTPAGVDNLYNRMDRMTSLNPLYCDVTWGAGGSTTNLSLEISANAQDICGLEINMHMTCTNVPVREIRAALTEAKDAGITNILALRGDSPRASRRKTTQQDDTYLLNALDLVKFIKQEFGDHFGISVSGHPEKHPDAVDEDTDFKYLKEKVDAGGDFIVTQFFYDTQVFHQFVAKCRDIGITCPIIPGIMPIQNYASFIRMTKFCQVLVPRKIIDDLEPIKDNDEAVKEYGVELGIKMCRELVKSGAKGFHFYTLNLERSVRLILEGLLLVDEESEKIPRELPWKPSTLEKRQSEGVRPIFWANRPKSYLNRTSSWDEFPNGRWGDNRSPAFGDLIDSHYTSTKHQSDEESRAMWGENLVSEKDVFEVFAQYVMGSITKLPWCEEALHLETSTIKDKLVAVNRAGFLTINSQPSVNAASSEDPLFGWGGPGGKVYQKAYVEFFTSPKNLALIMSAIQSSENRTLEYQAVDVKGNSYSNGGKTTTAVTWGAFPNKEILQPTIVDTDSFMAWKDEAFALWLSSWGQIYSEDSASFKVIKDMHDTYFLVSIVENDFIQGDIWRVFEGSNVDGTANVDHGTM